MVRYIWAPYRALERYSSATVKSTARGLQLLRVQTEEVVHLISTMMMMMTRMMMIMMMMMIVDGDDDS